MPPGERPAARVSCLCGTTLRIDTTKAGRRVRCPSCNQEFGFVLSVDPRSRRAVVSLVVPSDAIKVEGETLATLPKAKARPAISFPPPPPPPPEPVRTRGRTIKAAIGNCPCGGVFPVDESELTSIAECPKCGVEYHVVVKLEPGTRAKTVILVPAKTGPARRPTITPGPKTARRTQVPRSGK